MLRVTLAFWWTLLGIWLMANHLAAQSVKRAAPVAEGWPRQVTGFGADIDKAKKDALNKATLEVAALLHQRYPTLRDWKRAADYVEQNLLDGPGKEGDEVPTGVGQFRGKSWVLTVKAPNLDSLAVRASHDLRADRTDDRLRWALQMLIVVVIGLAVLAGHLYVMERSASRFRLWSRAAAMVSLAAAWTAWWYLKDLLFGL